MPCFTDEEPRDLVIVSRYTWPVRESCWQNLTLSDHKPYAFSPPHERLPLVPPDRANCTDWLASLGQHILGRVYQGPMREETMSREGREEDVLSHSS